MKDFIMTAVRDELTETFMQPIFTETKLESQRLFAHQLNSIPLWKDNASDYSLYALGTYNATSGEIKSHVEKICSGTAVRREEEK